MVQQQKTVLTNVVVQLLKVLIAEQMEHIMQLVNVLKTQ